MGYKRHKKVIQEKTETVRKIFEKEVPQKMKKNTKIISPDLKRLKRFQEKLSFYQNNIKNTRKTLKGVIGKTKINENRLPKKDSSRK